MQLTQQDCDVLIEALCDWEKSGLEGQMVGGLFGALLSRGDEDAKLKMQQEQERQMNEFKRQMKIKKERAIMIQAKLIQLRDSLVADRAIIDA